MVFRTATSFDTPRLMEELVDWARSSLEKADFHPLVVITMFVVVFLENHLFEDGNGRLS